MLAKGGLDHAWFFTNPDLGWPLGQQVYDLPQSLDNLNLLVLKVLGLVFGDVGTTINVFFVLTFAGVAVSAYLVLRALRVTGPTAFVVALLYTFLPYHFARGVPHLLLSAYWVVPLAVYVMLRVVSDRPPFTVGARHPPWLRRSLLRSRRHPVVARMRRDRVDGRVLRGVHGRVVGGARGRRLRRESATASAGVGRGGVGGDRRGRRRSTCCPA